MNWYKNYLLILILTVLMAPIVVEAIVSASLENMDTLNSARSDSLKESSSNELSLIEEESRLFLEEVNRRLTSDNEDPDTPTQVFVYWSDRQPDFPDWVVVDKAFNLIPVIQVTCALKDVPRLNEEINYVDYVVSVGEGVLSSISGFSQELDPYVGEFPLLLNETHSLVSADNKTTTGAGVIIAILSTGINDAHPMLDDMDDDLNTTDDPKILDSFDADHDEDGESDDETDDNNGRGTALASIVAGTDCVGGKLETSVDFSYPFPYSNNYDYETQEIDASINIGTQMGLAPEAYLFDVKITDDDDTYGEDAVIHGIEWAVEHGADVILLDDVSALATGPTMMWAIESATSLGCLVIVPAGDFDPDDYPSVSVQNYDDDYIAPYYTISGVASEITALTVGATTETDALWVQSNRGPVPFTELSKPDVVAPGVHMIGANTAFSDNEADNPGGWDGDNENDTLYYDVFSSTSVAAAVVAGVSANLIESYPGASPTAIKIAIRNGATDLGFNEMAQGKGKINLAEASTVLENAPKEADNWVGHTYQENFGRFAADYTDFEGLKILFDGAFSLDAIPGDDSVSHDWSEQPNGILENLSESWNNPYNDAVYGSPINLDNLGVPGWQKPYVDLYWLDLTNLGYGTWQHPYNDTVPGEYWMNVTYAADTVNVTIQNLTIQPGDNLTIYSSNTINNPILSTELGTFTNNITWADTNQSFVTSSGNNCIFYKFASNGNNDVNNDPVFGLYGFGLLHGVSDWQNMSYTQADRLHVEIDDIILSPGDEFRIYESSTVTDPNPALLYSTSSSASGITRTTDDGNTVLFYEFYSDGDNDTMGDSSFGFNGTVYFGGSTWYNVTYPTLADKVSVVISDVNIESGDELNIYESNNATDPNPVLIGTPITGTGSGITRTTGDGAGNTSLFFEFVSDGDNVALGDSSYGMNGTIDLYFWAHTTPADEINGFEFSDLALLLEDMGAEIEFWYPKSAITTPSAAILAYYDIYVLGQPLAATYSGDYNLPSEEAYYKWLSGNLTSYLDAGGRVLFIGDNEFQYYNYATNALGVTWNQGGGGGPTTDFNNAHELMTTPFAIEELLIDAPYTYFSGSAETLVQESGKPTVVYYDQNNGKAVFVADEDVFNDELWDDPFSLDPDRYNNSQFAMNIFYWLTGTTYQSGEKSSYDDHFRILSYSSPQMMIDGDPWDLDVEIQNIGNYTSQAWVAFGLNHTPSQVVLGYGAMGNDPSSGNDGIFNTSADDNANDTWGNPDFDIGVDVMNTTGDAMIEFYYNISEDYPIDHIAFPMIWLEAAGMNSQTAECMLYLNGYQIGPIYETNTTTGGSGMSSYPIFPMNILKQYNNTVEIIIPANFTLRVDYFTISGYNFSGSLGNITHLVTPALAPNEKYTVSYQYTPSGLIHPTSFEPRVQVYPYNLTYAYISPGYVEFPVKNSHYKNIKIDYGYTFRYQMDGYYSDPNSEVYAIPKIIRRGDLPLLYEITPGSLDSSTSVKIVRFPGDIRVDGLTIMSSEIVNKPSLGLSGQITSVVGLGNYSESLAGLAYHTEVGDPELGVPAPDYFYINDTWTATNHLYFDYLNHSSRGPILQTDIPTTQTPGSITGTLSLYENGTVLHSINLQLEIIDPSGSFLLYDDPRHDKIDNLDYDKLWDQVFEMADIAAMAGYDIDSLYQEWYLFEHRTHIDLDKDLDEFFDEYVCNVPPEEDLPYSGIIAVSMDSEDLRPADAFFDRGGSLIQFGTDFYLGPELDGDISFVNGEIATLVDGSDFTNPLLEGVDQLFGFGGDYMLVSQDTYDRQQNYDIISGQNWLYTATVDKPNHDIAVIYHDAIYPQRFSKDTGKYLPWTDFDQEYEGMKIIVASENMGHSWFLEQTDYWAYASMQYAESLNVIDENFSVNLGNRKFIENIFKTAANQAPEIESVSVSPEHVTVGDNLTVRVKVSDDQPLSSLTVAVPEKLTDGNLRYVELAYDSNSGEFIGSIRIIDTDLVNNWNIYIFDEFYRLTLAEDSYWHYIPKLNVLPLAMTTTGQDFYPYSDLKSVARGDMITLTIYYTDVEDGSAINCNTSLVYYKNSNETEIVYFEVFSGGTGRALFFIDTTSLSSGTHVVVANVTDTDGGSAVYELAAFNIGSGSLYRAPGAGGEGVDLGPVVGIGSVAAIGVGAAGGLIFYLRKTGKSLGGLFGRD